jgi:hypothetical protein
MLIGYERNVQWLESACTDLLLLEHLQQYANLKRMWSAYRKRYSGLVERTGMTAHTQ